MRELEQGWIGAKQSSTENFIEENGYSTLLCYAEKMR